MTRKIISRAAHLFVALLLTAGHSFAAGPRISEPDTKFYGRIVQRYKDHEFVLTSGELSWTLQTSGPAGKTHHFATQLAPLGEGRYSYQLRIPHQLLAYDLSVSTNVMAMPASGSQIAGISVALDGQPLTVMPIAVADLSLSPASRARALRVDLELGGTVIDSDNDGLPDWWEDAHGLDKWNSADAARAFSTDSSTSNVSAQSADTFAKWRAALFPDDTRELAVFGQDDADGDGISNLVEYAFDLDPHRPDASTQNVLPQVVQNAGIPELIFRRRVAATDISFHIDISTNLLTWTDATAQMQQDTSAMPGRVVVRRTKNETSPRAEFFRIRVVLLQP